MTDDAYHRSSVLYQLSVLQRGLKNGPAALAASLAAYKDGESAKSVYAMANARMAESAVMELLDRPARELEAMEEARAIARASRSEVAEARSLVNLSDIRLRRKQFLEALDLSRRSLKLAQRLGDSGLAATCKANIGFSLLGLGQVGEGKRFTDEALAEYERAGATAETAKLIGEYGRNLEQLGDYKGALALYHRERMLNDEISMNAAAGAARSPGKIRNGEAQPGVRPSESRKRAEDGRDLQPRHGAADLVVARWTLCAVVYSGGSALPQAAGNQPASRSEERGAGRPEHPGSVNRSL